jgi:hypothetical protein
MAGSGYKIVSLKITTSKALTHIFHSTYIQKYLWQKYNRISEKRKTIQQKQPDKTMHFTVIEH